MKAIASMIWGAISDKHTVAICMLCIFSAFCFSVYMFFVPVVYHGSTIAEAVHNHSKRVPVFNMDTNDAQTEMIIANREHAEYKPEYDALLFSLERHKDRQVDYLNEGGNFKSDRHRTIWESNGKNLDERMDELKEKMKGNQKSFSGALMIAQRQK